MDPKDTFKERYNEYLEGRDKQFAGSSLSKTNTPTKTRAFSPNKFYVLGIIAGLMIVGPVGAYLFLSNQIFQNATTSQISSVNVKQVAKITVTEAQIDTEMQKIWSPYYSQVKNDPKLRAVAKANIVRQKLIQQGLSQNHIQTAAVASDNPIEQEQKEEDALMQKVLNWRKVDYTFVFVNPDSTSYDTDVTKITYSYNLLKKYLDKGKTMQQAYDTAKTDPQFFKPITVTTDKLSYQNSFDKPIAKKLFSYKKGQTTDIINSGGGTFIMANITDANVTPYSTLDQYLAR